jgi:DNA-binding transcriptional MerR regulator
MFRIQQFSKLAHVNVRTLHHYDRVGLLSPTHRSASGYPSAITVFLEGSL